MKQNKIQTAFRLSKTNVDLLSYYQKNLGISRTSVLELLLTIIAKDKKLMLKLMAKAFMPLNDR